MSLVNISNEFIHAAIDPFGAELVTLAHHGQPNVLWEKDNIHWNRVAPNLFPIVGRLKNDSYTFEGKEYKMSQHGFARDRVFDLESQSATSVTFLLKSDQETREKYPFEFEFRVIYTLENTALHIAYSTRNVGNEIMPYSVGGHPGFNLSGPLSEFSLHFPEAILTERHLLYGSQFSGETAPFNLEKSLKLQNEFFSRDAIVFIRPPFNIVTLAKEDEPILSVHAYQWDAIGIWTKEGAPFLCIEPWWGYADRHDCTGNILEKSGMHFLGPNEQETLSYHIALV
jgi:galactose mutarotase-like enzyme